MNIESVTKALQAAKEQSKERKFSQTVDLIIALKGLNLKKPEEQVEFFVDLPHAPGKQRKICALVGPDLEEKAKESCDLVITQAGFDKYKDKKEVKKLATTYDYFIAQADLMPKVAAAFGRALGPRGKMPNPKAGCILPPKAPVQPVVERLQKLARIAAKKQLAIQLAVGKDDMPERDVAENVLAVYNHLAHHLPAEKNNIKHAYLKYTMGKPVLLD
ncbi:50S ribosomal protein L1 [Candidatus Woesearchaeota archaeon]|nr:50S ribosomal protein L1 [Candidatus Woesearchaeota archaeon]